MTEKRGAPPDSALRPNPPGVREPRRLTILLLAVAALLGLFMLGGGNVLAQTAAGITVDPRALGALTEAAGAAHSASFTVALDTQPSGDVTLTLAPGPDVSLDQTTLTFPNANWNSAQTVTVTAVDDSIDEAASENFSIALSASGGGYDSATAQVTGSVTDDDTATFTATLDKTTLAEADAGGAAGVATLTVTKTSSSVGWPDDRDIGLTLTDNARVGEDFTLTDGDGWTLSKPFILRFAAGATETTAIISVIDDAHDDDDETLSIAVDADGAAIRTTGPLTLTDDDDPPLKLSALAVATAAARQMFPVFAADTFHYAVGCKTDDAQTTSKLTVTLSAADATTRMSVNGVQVANQNGEIELTGLDGYSDVKIVLSNASGASATYTVHCLPKVFPDFETTKQAGAWDGLITMKRGIDSPSMAYIAIVDNNGVPRFHQKVGTNARSMSHFRTHKTGKYPYSYALQHGVIKIPLGGDVYPDLRNYEQVILNDDLAEVERVRTAGLAQTDNHDFVIRENGNYIFLSYEPIVRDFTGYIKRTGDPWGSSAKVKDSIIQETTAAGVKVHEVNSWDLFPLDDCKQGSNGYIDVEWAHVNSLEAVGDDYIASYRRCNQVLRINKDTGNVVWRLGLSSKDDAYWTAKDGKAPLKIVGDPYGEFCGQHSARMIANGHILIFDNGGPKCNGPRRPNRFSRVVEYALDLERGTATFVRHHSLRGELDEYAPFQGIIELMDNGNWLISWGGRMDTAVTEVIPGPRWSETQGAEILTVKNLYNGGNAQTRSYPLSPGTLERAWPPGALTETTADSASNSTVHLGASDTVNVVVAFSRPVVDFAANSPSISVTGATGKSVAPHIVPDEAAHAYLVELTPAGDAAVEFELIAGQACADGGICAKDGSTLSTVRTKRSVAAILAVSGLADASLAENTAYGPVTPSVAPAPTGSATWSLEGDDAGDFTINSGTGALSMVARDFEAPADADADNVYEVTVRATDTAGRTGAQSIEVTVTDADEPPGVPAGLTLSAAIGSLTATWSAGAAPAGATPPATTAYNVQYRLSSDTAWTLLTPSPTTTSATIDGLTGGSAYDVQVQAVNPEGRSAWTTHVSGTPTTAGITATPTALGTLTEAAGSGHSSSFTVALDAQPSGDVTLTLTHGADVSLDQTTLSFTSANWSSAQTVTVTAVDDSIDEAASENFSIALSASGGGYGSATAQVTGSVTDDDTATFTATLDKTTLAEADAGGAAGVATLTVTITSSSVSWPADRDIGLTLSGSALVGEDFTLTDGDGWTLSKPFILRFGAGATETTAIISVIDDAHDDDDETLSIAVDADGAAIGTAGPLTLTDDDDPPLKLSALAVTTTATRQMYPAFDADTFHYAVGCETDDAQTTGKLTVTLSAADATTRVSVNGVQAANQNGVAQLTGLDGYSDVKIVLSNASGVNTTYTVHCLPKVFPDFETTKQAGAWDGLITMKRGINSPAGAVIAIIDNNGVPRFHQKMTTTTSRGMGHFKKHRNGKYPYSYALQYGVLNTKAGDPVYPTRRNMEQVILREDLTEVERVRTVGLQHTDIHDFVIRANGNYVFLSYETQTHDLTGYIKSSGDAWGSTAKIRDPIIQEVTPQGEVVHEVNGWDLFHLDDCKQGSNQHIKEDWAHLNSLQAVGGDYIGGYRFCNQALRINAQTGNVVWRLGLSTKDDAHWIARDGKAPLKIVGDPYGEFCGQHSARMIANGHILIFDNGGPKCNGPRRPNRFSRVVEYALDLERGTATFVRHHSLRGELDEYAPYQGIIELMDNGNWLISWGGVMDTAVTEVIPGPRWSETQGAEILTVKNLYNGGNAQTRSYPLSPGTLERAWPPGALTETTADSASNSSGHLGTSDTVNVVVAFSRPVVDFAANTPSVSVTGATVKSVTPHIVPDETAHAYLFELTPTGDAAVEFVLVTGQVCNNGGICAKDGSTLSNVRTKRTVPRIMEISGLANASVAENTAYGPVTPSVAPAPTGAATWSLEGDDADDFTINSGTGALSMVARDFETPADADGDNVYEVTVRVTDTAGRTDAQSIEVTVTDVNEPPGVPAGLTLSAASGSLTATWSAGAAPAGTTPPATTAYNVQYRLSSDTAWVPLTPGRKDTSATIDGLTGGSTYDVRVRAKNPEDRSAWTVPVSGTPTAAGITADPQALGALIEAAGAAHSASFTVALDAQPSGDVTLTLTHGADVSLDQATLSFTSANWNSAQTVTVTAVDDSIDEAASESFSIDLSASGGGYDGVTAQVTGSVTDDDTATFTATLDNNNTLAEADAGDAAGVATLTVTITNSVSWPEDRDIGLTLTGNARVGEDFTLTDGDGWTLSKPFILRFGAGATETTAIIGVIDDAHDDDDETVSIAVDADGAAIDTVGPLTLTDNDGPPLKLSALGVTTASDLKMYPAFAADTFHYAVGCETEDAQTTGKLTVTLSAADANTRVAVNGVQVASQNGETELTGLNGYSDVKIVLSNASGASTTYTVHCLPKVFLNFVTTKQPGAWEGLITISGWNVPGNAPPYIAIIDNNGVPRFHRGVATNNNWVIQFRTHKKGKYPYSYAVQHGVSDYDRNYEQVVLDHDLTEVARIRTAGLQQTDSHDFVIRENGNYVLLAYEPNVRNMTGYTDMEGNPFGSSANVIDSIIQEVTPAGQQVHIVNSWDVLDLDDCKQGRNGPIHDDYAHINSVQVVGGDYITSYRHCSQALRINAQTGKVVWRLGLSRKSDAYWIARDGRAPLKIVGDPYGEFCGQHSPRMIANGNLILFDNGGRYCNGARKPKQFSRAVEYALDLERGTATFVRHHFLGGAPDNYAISRGIIELMDNGNWLLSWGTKLDPAVTEVIPGPRGSETQGQQLLSVKLSYPDTSIQTRAYPLSPGTLDKAWPPGPPEELIAESAYNSTVHLGASDTVNVVVAFSRPVVDFAKTSPSISVTGATVKSVAPHIVADETAHAYLFELTPTGDAAVEFELIAGQACADGGICAKDGSTLSTVRTKRSVALATVPGAPTSLTATANGRTQIDLTWTAPAGDGGAPITGYKIEVSTNTGTTWTNLVSDSGSATTTHEHTGLTAGTTRRYRVSAINSVGAGAASTVTSATTAAATTPSAPTSLTATANGRTQIDLSWAAPASDGGATITGYKIEVSENGGSTWTNLVSDSGSATTTHEHTGLTAGTTRRYRVSAINSVGASAASTAASATTAAAGTPGAPTSLTATANGRTQINLTWTAPVSDGGATITGYKIEVSADAGSSWSTLVTNTTSTTTSYSHASLSTGTPRHYRVSAINSVGAGAASTVTSATTAAATTPSAPTSLTATANGRTQIDLSWAAPASDGGATITGYKIEVSENGGSTWTNLVSDSGSATTTHEHTGLTAGTTRRYRVSAINSVGASAASTAASATTAAAGTPGAPTSLTATANGRTQINLTWTAPVSDGGATITGYKIEVSADAGSSWSTLVTNTTSTTTSYSHASLSTGTPRHYRVSAINSVGAGAASTVTSATTAAATTPSAPTSLTATANGRTRIDLSWAAPASDGGSTITGYKIEVSENGGSTWTNLVSDSGSATTTHEHTGLTAGTTRRYRVSAINSVGASAASTAASATTAAAGTPGAPTSLTATANGRTQINLTWTAPVSDGGATITGYKIEVSADAGSSWSTLVTNTTSTTTSYSHASLSTGTPRHYRVSAINSVGAGAASTVTSATTAAATTPSAPTSLTATANGRTRIDLSWAAPASDGGATITGYKIEVSENGGSTWTNLVSDSGSATTTHEHTGLTAGTTRRYRVSAINSVGASAASTAASATTAAAGTPGAPTSLTATANGRTQINLTWTAPVSDGGATITGYKIEVSADAGSSWSTLVTNTTSTTTSYSHASLSTGTPRHYRVSAINSVGAGAASTVTSATTAAATTPSAPTSLTATANGRTQINLTWTAPVSDGGATITGYKIEVSADAGSSWSTLVTNTTSTTTSYSHASLSTGTTRRYRVSAINSVGAGAASNVASATTTSAAPEAVADLAATSASASAINLKWTAPGNGGRVITGYRLERKTGAGSYAVVSSSIAANATSYADSSLSAGTAYTYRIRAVNAVGNGGWSNEASATTGSVAPPPPVTPPGGGGGGGGIGGGAPANQGPVFIDRPKASRSVPEGTSEGASFGDPVAATDLDNDALTYTLRGGDADSFDIDRQTGQLLVKAALDYETKASYSLRARVSDGEGGSDLIDLTVMVTDVDEPPAIAGPVATEYEENSVEAIAAYTAMDPEGTEVTWSLGGDDAGAFTVSGAGVLAFNAPPDYEAPADADTDNVYQVMLQATDLKGMMGMLHMVVSVTDVENEGIWTRYDFNNNGLIERDEALAAVVDYFADLITKQQALEVVSLYFAS